MSFLEPDQCNIKEFCIQKALDVYNSKQYSNILKIACAFVIPYLIMKNCVSGKILQVKTLNLIQNLSNVGKKILLWWITYFIIIKFFILPKLVLEMAEEIY